MTETLRSDSHGALPMVAHTLSAGGHPNSNAPGRHHEDDHNLIAHTLRSEGADASEDGTGRGVPLAIAIRGREGGGTAELGGETANALRASTGGGDKAHALLPSIGVRRLTPTECERLQGFPDNWTDNLSDSGRYRVLGNAVCVPVARWIGERLMKTEDAG